MRTSIPSAARLGHTVGELPVRHFRFVCRDCLSQRATISAPGSQQRRGYANKKPLTERLRSRIWGGEAPGPKNVYGQPRLFPGKENKEAVDEDVEEEKPQPKEKTFYAREAFTVDQAKEEDAEYEPAETWDGLARIGGPTGWWEKEWDQDNQFVAFRPSRRPSGMTNSQLFNEVRRAYIEASAMRNISSSNLDISRLPTHSYLPFHTLTPTAEDGKSTDLSVPAKWQEEIARLAKADGDTPSGLTDVDREALETEELDPAVEASNDESAQNDPTETAWRALPLSDLDLKFALVKRVIQLTGALVPDPAVYKITTLGQLLDQLKRKEAPKKTATILNGKSHIVHMPNIHIYANRQTWVDREKHLGRYKTITRELEKRGLPLPNSKKRGRSVKKTYGDM